MNRTSSKANRQTEQTEQRKSNLEQCMALWTQKGGKVLYVTGIVGEGADAFRVVGFFNGKKKNPKEPDLRVYEQLEKGHSKEALASLWVAQAKSGGQYYWGRDNEQKRLVAFLNPNKKNPKEPDIRVYYQQEVKQTA